jgi:PAS domain S-box-containing protein
MKRILRSGKNDQSSGKGRSVRFAPQTVVFILLLLALNVVGFRLVREWIGSVERWFVRADSIVPVVHKVSNLLAEADLLHGFYLLTREGGFADRFNRVRGQIEFDILPQLDTLMRSSDPSAPRIHEFDHLVRDKLALLATSMFALESDGAAAEHFALLLGQFNSGSEQIHAVGAALLRQEEQLRILRDHDFGVELRRFSYILFTTSWVLFLIAVVAVRRFRRELTLRERAEALTREGERLERVRATELQTLLETVPAIVLIAHDAAARVVSGSRKAYEALRLPLGSNTSKTALIDAPSHFRLCRNGVEIPPDQLPVQLAARSGQPVRDTEFEIEFSDGMVRHLFGSVEPLFDEYGKPRGAVAAFTDVTALREAELLLRASEERLSLSLETGRLGVFDYDYDTGLTRWNESEFKLLGFAAGEMAAGAESFFARVHPEDQPRLRAEWQHALEGHDLEAEFRIMTKDGVERWLGARGKPIRDEYGRKRWFTGVNIDITRSKSVEAELSKAVEERTNALNTLHAFIEAAPMGIALFDESGRYRFINKPLAEMSGLSAEYCIGRTIAECVPTIAPKVTPLLQRVLEQGETVADFEFEEESPAKPGERHTWIESWFPIFGIDQRVTGAGVVVQDITERKRAESELARHRDRLQDIVAQKTAELALSLQRLHTSERLAALGTLAAGLGHDLANLVLPIRARLESLAVSPLTQEMRADVVAIGQALDHLGNLSAGMRLMALDPTRTRAASEAVDLTGWWDEANAVLRGVLPRHVRLEGKIGRGIGAAMPRHQLLQAVFNLVQNAGEVLGTSADGIVTIDIGVDPGAPDSHIIVRVTDNGPGMSAGVKARCFDPYFSTKGRAISTGMGLSLVRGLVESVGGTVAVEATEGQGTSFLLRLPRSRIDVSSIDALKKAPHVAAISLHEVRQAALVAMIAERLNLKVERSVTAEVPRTSVWITDSASRPAIEHYLSEAADRRVIYLGSASCDPVAIACSPTCRGRVIALPARPAPGALRDALGQVVGG